MTPNEAVTQIVGQLDNVPTDVDAYHLLSTVEYQDVTAMVLAADGRRFKVLDNRRAGTRRAHLMGRV